MPPTGHVPASPDRFFGREAELRRLADHLAAGDRLVSITGLSGMGKTRLAAELAARTSLPARWVDLSDVRAADAVHAAIVHALDLPDPAGLRSLGPVLLVLDAVDGLDPAASAALAALVAAAPDARFICTARAPLRLRGERRLALGPLAEADGVALLTDRSPAGTEGLDVLARELDGMPLAIEIAAALLRHLPLADLRRLLGHRLQLLVTDEADRPARHRSLSAAIEASAAQLSAGGLAALQRLTVFRGGFRLDAASAVLGAPAPEALRELVDSGLVRLDPSGRYAVPTAVAAWAAPPDAEAEVLHAAFYARLGEPDALRALVRSGEAEQALAAESANLRAALDRALAREDTDRIGPLALALAAVLRRRGPAEEALRALELATERIGAEWVAPVRTALGAVLREVGRCDDAVATLSALVEVPDPDRSSASGLRDPVLRAEVLFQLGMTHGQAGRPAEAESWLLRALDLLRGRDEALAARVLVSLALVHAESDPDRARDEYREALGVARRFGDRVCEGTALSNLALLDRRAGRFAAALAGFEAALEVHRALDHRRAIGRSSCMLGSVLAELGEVEAGRERVEAGLALHREVGDRWYEAVATALLGQIAQADGDLWLAREHLERARAIHRELGHELAEAAVSRQPSAVSR